jgi:hypothetical protein
VTPNVRKKNGIMKRKMKRKKKKIEKGKNEKYELIIRIFFI